MSLIADMAGAAKPILTTLLMPPAGPIFLVFLGLLLLLSRAAWRRWGIALQALGMASLWFLSCHGAAVWLSANILPQLPAANPQLLQQRGVQAVVVLGGGSEPLNLEYGAAQLAPESLARVRYGYFLNRDLDLPMAFTGGLGWAGLPNAPTEAQTAQAWTAMEGKKPFRWLEEQSRDTAQNARLTYALLQKNGIQRIALVTQSWHMPRSVLAFEKAGFTVVPAPMGFITTEDSTLMEWLPTAHGLRKSRRVLREKLGLMLGAY